MLEERGVYEPMRWMGRRRRTKENRRNVERKSARVLKGFAQKKKGAEERVMGAKKGRRALEERREMRID
jgi:hypothetical protein